LIKVSPRPIPDELLIAPKVFDDERGIFFEGFNKARFEAAIGKPLCVAQGEVFDEAVNPRKNLKTFSQWVGEILSDETKRQLWIPMSFAQVFVVLSEMAAFLYKTTNHYYATKYERYIAWNDNILSIRPPKGLTPVFSAKDTQGKAFAEAEAFA